jgi:hypothetical protein
MLISRPLFAALLLAWAGPLWASPAKPSRRTTLPSVILIVADDLGYGDLGCYGQTKIKTPNLDRLAAEGMKFTQAYAGNTVCAPSRCSLMTGKHSGHGRVRSNAQVPLEPDDVTIAEVLRTAGYRTGKARPAIRTSRASSNIWAGSTSRTRTTTTRPSCGGITIGSSCPATWAASGPSIPTSG